MILPENYIAVSRQGRNKMKRKTRHLLTGIVFLIISFTVLYFNLSMFKGSFSKLWPSLILLAGTILYILYFSTKKKKNRLFILFVATFIALASVSLFILSFTSKDIMPYLWPSFPLALGMSILSLYFYGKKKRYILLVSSLVITASLLIWVIYLMQSKFGLVIGVVLLITGAAFLTRGLIHEADEIIGEKETASEEETEITDTGDE